MKAFCPFCEKEYNNLEAQTRDEITTLNGVTAEWQKKYIVCPDCGEELYNGELHDANLRVVYAACKVSDIDKPVEDLCDYVLKLRMENAALRERLEKTIELPSGDRVWYIAKDEEGQESYIIPKPTSSLTVEELKYEMNKKYFPTREAAEARLEEIKEKAELRARLEKAVELPRVECIMTKEWLNREIIGDIMLEWCVLYKKDGYIMAEPCLSKEAAEARLREIQEGRNDART